MDGKEEGGKPQCPRCHGLTNQVRIRNPADGTRAALAELSDSPVVQDGLANHDAPILL